MKRLLLLALPTVLALPGTLKAELHDLLKPHAENYDRAMKGYEKTRKARIDQDRTRYLLVLDASKKRYEKTKRPDLVAVIDAEIKAVKAGPASGEPPAELPEELHPYRKKYVDAPENAAEAIASVQKFSCDTYLKALDGLEKAARRGKSPELEADVVKERKRVLAEMKAKAKDSEATDTVDHQELEPEKAR